MITTVFVDTNVLVYSRDASEIEKQPKAEEWMSYLWKEKTGRLSYQVLNEFYVTVTGKLDPSLDTREARRDVGALLAWEPISMNRDGVERAWSIQDRYQLSWWDSLIASAALIAGCRYLLTEDLQQDQLIDQLRVVNPFLTAPGALPI